MDITGFIKVESLDVIPGDSVKGMCIRHENDEFTDRSITTSNVVAIKILNDKTRLVRTESGSVYLIFT